MAIEWRPAKRDTWVPTKLGCDHCGEIVDESTPANDWLIYRRDGTIESQTGWHAYCPACIAFALLDLTASMGDGLSSITTTCDPQWQVVE